MKEPVISIIQSINVPVVTGSQDTFVKKVWLWSWKTVYKDVLTSGGWSRGVPLYTEVSSFQGVGMVGFHCMQRCPHFRGYTEVSSFQGVGIVYRSIFIPGGWNRLYKIEVFSSTSVGSKM